jgi:hypothetical protein
MEAEDHHRMAPAQADLQGQGADPARAAVSLPMGAVAEEVAGLPFGLAQAWSTPREGGPRSAGIGGVGADSKRASGGLAKQALETAPQQARLKALPAEAVVIDSERGSPKQLQIVSFEGGMFRVACADPIARFGRRIQDPEHVGYTYLVAPEDLGKYLERFEQA